MINERVTNYFGHDVAGRVWARSCVEAFVDGAWSEDASRNVSVLVGGQQAATEREAADLAARTLSGLLASPVGVA